MGTALGLKIGSTTCVAVPASDNGPEDSALVCGPYLELAPDVEPTLAGTPGPHRVTGFADRVGDPVALVSDDGRQFTGEDLYAAAMAYLAVESDRWNADSIVVACPNEWQRHNIDALQAAAAAQDLTGVTVVPEAVASVAALESRRGPVDGVQVVYDLGGSALDIAVVSGGPDSHILGRPLRSEDISGAQFDHLVLGSVLASVGADEPLDPFDPATVTALTELRARCATAREALSVDTETAVSIDLPGLRTDVRLVRSEIEDLLRGPLTTSMSLVGEALVLADTDLANVSTIVLTGGGAATPLLSELVSSMLRIPVAVNADPTITSATGAATLAAATVAADATALAAEAAPAAASTDLVPSVSRAIAPAPRTLVTEPKTMSRTKRIAVVVGVAAAIALLTAGGLSVGTALTNDKPPTAGSSESTAPTSGAKSGAPSTAAGATNASTARASGGGSGETTTGPGSTRTPGSTGSPRAGSTQAPVAGQPGTAPTEGAPVAEAPPAESGGGDTSGGGGNTGGGDTSGGGGNTGGNGGSGGGGTPADVGNGVGGVVGGVGDGVGGVVGGVGSGVGGLLGGVLG